jgi:uncharacterized repeat protein (TIGR01451 family)
MKPNKLALRNLTPSAAIRCLWPLALTVFALLPFRAFGQGAPPPLISSFSPTNGPVGTKVTIQGQNLGNASSVQFGDVPAQFALLNTQQIVATVPTGATTAPITIVAPGGTVVSSTAFTVSVTPPPTITSFSPTSAPVGTEITIEGQNLAGATQILFGNVSATPRVGFSGVDLVVTVPVGAASAPLTVITPGGSFTTTDAFTVSATPPPVLSNFSPASGPIGTSVTINGQNLSGTTNVSFNGVAAQFTVFGNSISTTVPSGASSGSITVFTPGGSATSSGGFTVTLPGTPVITGFIPTQGLPGDSITINGANLETATSVLFNGVPAAFSVSFSQSVSATVPTNATSGPITVNTPKGTAVSATAFIIINPLAPQITSFTPNSGPSGTSVTINGTNFVNVSQVTFGGAPVANFIAVSSTQISALVPANAPSGPIAVTTPQGNAASQDDFFTPASLSDFEPGSGLPGTRVVIHGSNLTGALSVVFGTTNASFTNVSPTEIDAVVPAGATTGLISVATPIGFTSTANTFFVPPTIAQVQPASGLAGTTVTITGNNLLDANSVQFGGVSAVFSTVSENVVNAVVPSGASNGPITLTTPAGTASSPSAFLVGVYSDVAVSLSAQPDSPQVGDLLKYSIIVTNRGPADATNVVVSELLPTGVELVFPPSGEPCVISNNLVTCTVDSLGYGMAATLQLVTSVANGPYLTNKVSITSTSSDPDLSNNSTTLITTLAGAPPPVTNSIPLSVSLGANQIVLSWPVAPGTWNLQSASSLAPPILWSSVNTAPSVANGSNTVSASIVGAARFYRLSTQ